MLSFNFDPNGDDAMLTFGVGGERAAKALERHGIQGATLYGDRTVLYLPLSELQKALDLKDDLGEAEVSFGKMELH